MTRFGKTRMLLTISHRDIEFGFIVDNAGGGDDIRTITLYYSYLRELATNSTAPSDFLAAFVAVKASRA